MAPAKSALRAVLDGRRLQLAEVDALALVVFAELRQRAVDVDRLVVAGIAQQPHDALRLAQRIGADQMRALGKLLDRLSSRAISSPASGWRNTGRPNVASVMKTSHLTGSNGAQVGSAAALVVARGDDAQAAMLDRDLRRAEHMAGRMERHAHAVEVDRLADSRTPASRRQSPRHSAAP